MAEKEPTEVLIATWYWLGGKMDLSIWQQVRAEIDQREKSINVISAEGPWFENHPMCKGNCPKGKFALLLTSTAGSVLAIIMEAGGPGRTQA